jgi:hypothetical protein
LAAQIHQAEILPIGSPQQATAMQAIEAILTNPQNALWVSPWAQQDYYVGTKKVIGMQTDWPNAEMPQGGNEQLPTDCQIGKA